NKYLVNSNDLQELKINNNSNIALKQEVVEQKVVENNLLFEVDIDLDQGIVEKKVIGDGDIKNVFKRQHLDDL
ncbi:hypothetical protein KKA83_02515, partial [Patescibacteria group bacterium]|nr:hypothetical protein [Patescibacteria group bacterium]